MFEKLEIMRMAHAMAAHAGRRQTVIAANVANADTPGYRARDLAEFSEIYQSPGQGLRKTRAGHIDRPPSENLAQIDATARQSPDGNSVSIETQVLKASTIRHDHDVALTIYKSSLDILRMSVGRR